jgi:hypothetical protein
VHQVVDHAHQVNSGIADGLAGFYAQHASLIKTLGGAAPAIAIGKNEGSREPIQFGVCVTICFGVTHT